MTVDQFLAIDFGTDRKFELVDGVIQMMTGGTVGHSRVAGNIFAYLRQALRGSNCRPYNADAGLRISATNLRYPDVAVYCNEPRPREVDGLLALEDPRVIFEILSPSTERSDQRDKLEEYRALPSVDTIVFVDPYNELSRVVQRLAATSWRDDLFAQPHDVALPALGITIPHVEIFARD